MLEKDKNRLIIELIRLKNLVKEKRKYFTNNFDSENKISKLSGLINYLAENQVMEKTQRDELISGLKDNVYDGEKTISLIETEISSCLEKLGYSETKEQKQKIKEEISNDENKDLVQKYEQIIESIEKMIEQLDKTMSELDMWINKISESIHYDFNKKTEKTVEAEPSLEGEDFIPKLD